MLTDWWDVSDRPTSTPWSCRAFIIFHKDNTDNCKLQKFFYNSTDKNIMMTIFCGLLFLSTAFSELEVKYFFKSRFMRKDSCFHSCVITEPASDWSFTVIWPDPTHRKLHRDKNIHKRKCISSNFQVFYRLSQILLPLQSQYRIYIIIAVIIISKFGRMPCSFVSLSVNKTWSEAWVLSQLLER